MAFIGFFRRRNTNIQIKICRGCTIALGDFAFILKNESFPIFPIKVFLLILHNVAFRLRRRRLFDKVQMQLCSPANRLQSTRKWLEAKSDETSTKRRRDSMSQSRMK